MLSSGPLASRTPACVEEFSADAVSELNAAVDCGDRAWGVSRAGNSWVGRPCNAVEAGSFRTDSPAGGDACGWLAFFRFHKVAHLLCRSPWEELGRNVPHATQNVSPAASSLPQC